MMATVREKTQEVRRSHILEAAGQVFAERGYHRATIKDVARAAGVSDGSIYNVFANKTALLLGLLDPLAAASHSIVPSPAEAGDASSRVEGLIRQRWDAFNPETLQVLRAVLAEALVNDELRQLFYERVLAPALETGRMGSGETLQGGVPDEEARAASRPLVAAMMGLILLRLLGDPVTAQNWETFPARLARLFGPPSP